MRNIKQSASLSRLGIISSPIVVRDQAAEEERVARHGERKPADRQTLLPSSQRLVSMAPVSMQFCTRIHIQEEDLPTNRMTTTK